MNQEPKRFIDQYGNPVAVPVEQLQANLKTAELQELADYLSFFEDEEDGLVWHRKT